MRLIAAAPLILTMLLAGPAPALADVPPDQDQPSGYMDPDERSPLAALNPAESGIEVWIGPIVMGVFALILILFIRRFSKSRRQDKAQKDLDDQGDG